LAHPADRRRLRGRVERPGGRRRRWIDAGDEPDLCPVVGGCLGLLGRPGFDDVDPRASLHDPGGHAHLVEDGSDVDRAQPNLVDGRTDDCTNDDDWVDNS